MPKRFLGTRQICALFVLSLLIHSAGCGSGKPTVNTVAVSGKVTLDDKPISGATLLFLDATGGKNQAFGKTDESGNYKLAFASYDGAMPGNYKVVIEYLTDLEGKPISTDEGMDANMLKMEGKAKQVLSPNYSDHSMTQLTAEVKASGSNTIDFKLKSDGTL